MMNWDIFTQAANELKEFPTPIKKVLFSSIGEPLLNKNLPDMVKYVKGIGVTNYCEIITNASLLTRPFVCIYSRSNVQKISRNIAG